jgi:hypothetical protein
MSALATGDAMFGPPPVPMAGLDPSLSVVEERLAQFMHYNFDAELPFETYPAQQRSTVGRFVEFHATRRPMVPWTLASPSDVVAFLISKDATSRTIVHAVLSCPNLGAGNATPFGPCACPRRAKATSLRTATALLRAEFTREVSPLKWSPQTRSGNPCHSALVNRYLDTMEKAQARAGVAVLQAPQLSVHEFYALMSRLSERANDASMDGPSRFGAYMEACAFSIQFAAGARMGDLLVSIRTSHVRVSAISIAFRQIWGKTVRGFGRRRDYDLPVRDPTVCPVRRFCEYILAARYYRVDLTVRDASDPSASPLGFLFRQVVNGQVLPVPPTTDYMNGRLRSHLVALGCYRGQTVHSLRALHSVEAQLNGIDLASCASFVGWASVQMPAHYSRLRHTLGALMPLLGQNVPCDPAVYASRMATHAASTHRVIPLELYDQIAAESHFIDPFLD